MPTWVNILDYVDQIVGAQIRARREAIALSQEQLSDKTGLSCLQIQKYEAGKSRVSATRLAKLADALEVEVAFFFFPPDETNVAHATGPRDYAIVDDKSMRIERAMKAFATIKSETLRKAIMTIIEEIARMDADPAEVPRGESALPTSDKRKLDQIKSG